MTLIFKLYLILVFFGLLFAMMKFRGYKKEYFIEPDEFYKKFVKSISINPDIIILDLRTEDEFNKFALPGAMNIPFNNHNYQNLISNLQKDKIYYLYCHIGYVSNKTALHMMSHGFSEVFVLKGGISRWIEKGLDLEQEKILNIYKR